MLTAARCADGALHGPVQTLAKAGARAAEAAGIADAAARTETTHAPASTVLASADATDTANAAAADATDTTNAAHATETTTAQAGVAAKATAARGETAGSLPGTSAESGAGLRAESAQHARDFAGQRVFDRDDDQFDADRQGHIDAFENFQHPFHVLGIIAQHEHRAAFHSDDAAGEFGVGRQDADRVFRREVLQGDDL